MRRLPLGSAAVLALAIAAAFAVRVLPAYTFVFSSSGVNFQDNDSWYHMRVAHNIAAHFPHQSGFDPYAVFPGRQNAYTDPWDLAIAGVAGLLAFGTPSEQLIDQVGAWLPAFLGALLPIPLFWFSRRFFGEYSARWTALTAAALPGTLLWATHIGVPDHHVAECLLSTTALVLLCSAVEHEGRGRHWRTAVSGILLGICLCVRPAAIFVPATLALAALFEPLLAPIIAAALGLAGIVFLTSSGSVWASYTWLTLAGSITACLLAWALAGFWRKREWPKALLLPAAGFAAAVAIGIVAAVEPVVFGAMLARVRGYLPGGSGVSQSSAVGELVPLWQIPPGGVGSLFAALGSLWLPALPVLLFAPVVIWRSRRPALVLCAVWGLVMIAAGVIQMRMWVYGGPALAVAAGVGCAWLMARLPSFRTAITLATAAFLLGTSIPHGNQLLSRDGGPGTDWRMALTWLRRNTPEPLGSPDAWLRAWPALLPGNNFAYPPSAYGVITWWDYGDWVNAIAHRIPSTNGTQANADLVAAFLTSTSTEEARPVLSQLSARYAVLNSEVTLAFWNTIVQWSKRDQGQFQRFVFEAGPGGQLFPVRIYLPDYYRSMAVRMFHFDGRAVAAGPEVSVFTTRRTRTGSGPEFETVVSERKFPTEEKARDFMQVKAIQLNPGEAMIFGSGDPMVSCVNVEELTEVKRVFASGDPARPQTVKVFELKPAQSALVRKARTGS